MLLKTLIKYLLAMVLAAFAGFTAVHYAVYGMPPWASDTRLFITVEIRGTGGKPVPGAQLAVYVPEKRTLGTTNKTGTYRGEVVVPRAKAILLEARGPTYQIQKDLLIPRTAEFRTFVRMDPTEAKLGNIRLISKTLEELANATPQPIKSAIPQPSPTATRVAAQTTPLPENNGIPTASATHEETKGTTISVSSEKAAQEHNLPQAKEILSVLISDPAQNEGLRLRNIRKFTLRPLTSEKLYIEMTAHDVKGALKGGVIFRAAALSKAGMKWLLDYMWLPQKSSGNGKLIVQTTNSAEVRAYLNGFLLPAHLEDGRVVFDIIKPRGIPKKYTLSVTANNQPLIRKTIKAEMLNQSIHWSLPEPALSSR